MATQSFDVAVIGSGPGGYVAAIRAAQLGMKVAVVEKAQLGGVCLNWGCIPTKALLRSTDVLRLVKDATHFGIEVGPPTVNLQAMVTRSRAVAAQLNKGVAYLMKKNAIDVIEGHARLEDGGLSVTLPDSASLAIDAKNIILATGARPRQIPGFTADGDTVWTYREALVPKSVPRRLVIVGGGAIGIEFACFYRALGAAVTVVEMASSILPTEDAEVSAHVASHLAQDGVSFHVDAAVSEVRKVDGVWRLSLKSGQSIEADVILLAAGIVGNVEDLGLERTKVEIARSHIVTDAYCRTGEPGVYAIGDVAGPPWLAHKASHEAIICVEAIAGLDPHPIDPRNIAACTYSSPQIASIGLTEAQARAAGLDFKVGKFPLSANGKALAMRSPGGFAKVIFDHCGELLGAHLVGEEVTEMIQGFAIGKTLETSEIELARTVFPHPTMSEAMHEAVLSAFGRAIHI